MSRLSPTIPCMTTLKKAYNPPYYAKEIMVPVYKEGRQVYEPPPLNQIRDHAREELGSLESETKSFINPHIYKVFLIGPPLTMSRRALLTSHQVNGTRGK
jgi:nicotinate phosphoribosyltransferase